MTQHQYNRFTDIETQNNHANSFAIVKVFCFVFVLKSPMPRDRSMVTILPAMFCRHTSRKSRLEMNKRHFKNGILEVHQTKILLNPFLWWEIQFYNGKSIYLVGNPFF